MTKSKRFIFTLNGDVYGTGNADYMSELFNDYVATHELYGKDSIDVKIETIDAFKARLIDENESISEENNDTWTRF